MNRVDLSLKRLAIKSVISWLYCNAKSQPVELETKRN